MLDTKIETIGEMWLGTEKGFHSMVACYKRMAEGDENHRKECFAHDQEDEDNNSHFLLELVDNVAVISVRGHMVPGSEGAWGAYWGVVGYDDIRNAIIIAVQSGVKEILIDYDTPGGAVRGIMELSDFIKSIDIKITSFTGGLAASGGLWLATAGDVFYAARMAEVGSLGVLSITMEMTEMYKEMGINVRVFKSTPLKAAGNPYEKLTEEQAAQIQKNIDETHEFFIKEIAINRGLTDAYVSENIANGKVWYAAEAHELNLIDGIKTFDELVVAMLRETADNTDNFQQVQENDMAKRKVISDQEAAAIASGVAVEEVLEDSNTEAVITDEENTAADDAGTDTSSDTDDAGKDTSEETSDTGTENEDTEASSAAPDKSVTAVSVLQEQVSSLQDENVDLKVELKQAAAKATALEATHEGLRKVTAVAIQRCFVAIGSPAPDMEGLLALDASALLQQHAQVDVQVAKRFGAGRQVSVVEEEKTDDAVEAAAKVTNDILLKQARI